MIWRKLFIFLGIPLLIFYIFMMTIYFGFISTIWFIALLVGLSCLRKNKFWRRTTKMSIALFIFMFILISNPLYWPQQIMRHLNTSLIITPNAPAIQQLNGTSPGTFWYYMNTTHNVNSSFFYNNLNEPQQLHYIEEYVLWKIKYTYIYNVYGVIDYVATPTEALQVGTGDCQSRTVVMTSFLIYLGYDAWAVETPFHWYTRVYLTNGSYIYLYRHNGTDPIVRINDHSVIFEKNVFEISLLILQHKKINDPINYFIRQPIFWTVLIPLSFLIAYIFVLIIRTSGVPTQKKKMTNILFGGTFLNLAFLFILAISSLYPPTLLLITIILEVQLISHNFFMAPEAVDLENSNNKLKEGK